MLIVMVFELYTAFNRTSISAGKVILIRLISDRVRDPCTIGTRLSELKVLDIDVSIIIYFDRFFVHLLQERLYPFVITIL